MELAVSLSAQAVLERVHEHPQVRVSTHAYPYPPPPQAGPFLLCRRDSEGFWLRHYAGPLAPASPIACVTLHPRPWGTLIRSRFVVGIGRALPTRAHFQSRFLATLLLGIAGMPLVGPLALAPLFAYVGQSYFVHNTRWNAEMRAYGPAFLGLMGELFVAHILTEPEQGHDPYRGRLATFSAGSTPLG